MTRVRKFNAEVEREPKKADEPAGGAPRLAAAIEYDADEQLVTLHLPPSVDQAEIAGLMRRAADLLEKVLAT